jgi:hypothetical protein
MKVDEARKAVMERWNSLPPNKRQTDLDAKFFALTLSSEHQFKGVADYALICGWLLEDLWEQTAGEKEPKNSK